MNQHNPPKLIVPFYHGSVVGMEKAISATGLPRETIRRWCIKYGVGRLYRTQEWEELRWQISLPALRMVKDRDWDALAAFCSGERDSDLVERYVTKPKVDG